MNIDAKAREIVNWFDNFVCEAPNTPPDVYAAELSKRIAAALLAVRNQTLEEAAKVSEGIWLDAHDTDWDQGVNSAKRAIAMAVRSMKQKG
jgi:hypothetical protein